VTSAAAIPILTYHQIAVAPQRGAPYRSLYVHPRAFARQMAVLSALGVQVLGMGQLLPYLRGQLRGRIVGLTFDDGYVNNLLNAAPVLKRYGFGATVYAVSARLGRDNNWDAAKGIASTPLMDAAQLRAWQDAGLEVGAHTRHHVSLTAVDAVQQHDEIVGARAELEAVLDRPVDHFCYPYGDFDAAVVQQAVMAGYQTATTTRRGRARAGDDLFRLRRVPVLRSTWLGLFVAKVFSGYEDGRDR